MNKDHSKYFERIKKLYEDGRVNDLDSYVRNSLITPEEYEEISGVPYTPGDEATVADYDNALEELGVI